MDRSYVGKIERAIANPSLNVLCRLADLLEVDVSALVAPLRSKIVSTRKPT